MAEYFGAYLQNYNRAVILGTAPSVRLYEPDNGFKIGVNDINKFVNVNHLVILDNPSRFTKERLSIINKSNPDILISHINLWSYKKNFHQIKLASNRSSITQINEPNVYPYSIMSPYVAIIHAYKLGFDDIMIYGVDLTNHEFLSDNYKQKRVLKDISTLNNYFVKNNIKLRVFNKSSILSQVLDYCTDK